MDCEAQIAGVGIDICDVARIERLINQYGDAFLKKIFTDAEIAYCRGRADSAQRYAARYAAKEAMAKAIGTGFSGGITPRGLSVENDAGGAPRAVLDATAAEAVRARGAKKMLVSLTHLKDCAQAVAILSK